MSFIELVAQRRPASAPPGMQPPENAKDWFRIQDSVEDEDTTDVFVYDSIGGWFGMYADEFIEALGGVTTSKINLRLNSPGGSVFEGIAIANAIRNHPAHVTVTIDSLAASIASVIALAGDRVRMMPQSQFMVHNASGAAYGDATEMTKMADLLDKQSRNIAEAYAQHTGRPLAEWQSYMAEETWFTAEEAVAVGLADEVVPMRKKQDANDAPDNAALASVMNRSWDLSVFNHAGRTEAPAPVIAEKPAEAVETAGTTVTVDLAAGLTGEALVEMIRKTVKDAFRAEVEDAKKKLPPFLQPDEDEEEEEGDGDGDADDAAETEPDAEAQAEAEPEAAAEDEPAAEAVEPPVEPPTDAGPDAGVTPETSVIEDENATWLSLVDRLTDATSPSADDVFNHLKEAW